MEQRVCSFCGEAIEPGTGLMYVKRDGSVYYFDRRRCKLSLLTFHRLPRKFKWTRHYPRAGKKAEEPLVAAPSATELTAAAKKAVKTGPKIKA